MAIQQPHAAFLQDICLQIVCGSLISVPCCALLSSLVNLLPSPAVIFHPYEETHLYPKRPPLRPASPCRTVILPLNLSECLLVCHYVTPPPAQIGLSPILQSPLKSVFEPRAPALHLLQLVCLDQNLAHQLPLSRPVAPSARSLLYFRYYLLLSFP